MAPIIKIIAFITIIVGILNPYYFIATGLLWLLSVGLNYIKWYTVYTYNYVIKEENLTITKIYNYIKPEILADVKFKDILNLEIISEEDLENYDTTNKFFCYQKHFDLYLMIKTLDICFIIVANNYFYALLHRKIENSNR